MERYFKLPFSLFLISPALHYLIRMIPSKQGAFVLHLLFALYGSRWFVFLQVPIGLSLPFITSHLMNPRQIPWGRERFLICATKQVSSRWRATRRPPGITGLQTGMVMGTSVREGFIAMFLPSFFLSLLSGSVFILGLIDYNSSKWFEWKRVTLMKLWKDYVLIYLISLWRKRNEALAKKWIVFKTHKISLYYSTPLAKEQPVNTADTLEGMCATSTQHLQISTGIWILGRKQKQRQEVAASSWLVAHMNMLGVHKEQWDKCSPLEFREALLPMA